MRRSKISDDLTRVGPRRGGRGWTCSKKIRPEIGLVEHLGQGELSTNRGVHKPRIAEIQTAGGVPSAPHPMPTIHGLEAQHPRRLLAAAPVGDDNSLRYPP